MGVIRSEEMPMNAGASERLSEPVRAQVGRRDGEVAGGVVHEDADSTRRGFDRVEGRRRREDIGDRLSYWARAEGVCLTYAANPPACVPRVRQDNSLEAVSLAAAPHARPRWRALHPQNIRPRPGIELAHARQRRVRQWHRTSRSSIS